MPVLRVRPELLGRLGLREILALRAQQALRAMLLRFLDRLAPQD